MIAPRKVISDAMRKDKPALLDMLALRLASHEQHARVTSSESAYHAAMRLSRRVRDAIAHLQADDVDAVCADLALYVPVTECAEKVNRE